MKKQQYEFRLNIDVWDKTDLKKAAEKRALQDGLTLKDWRATRKANCDPIAADLHMLLDPGVSPDGTSINDSIAEFLVELK
jgi:hypothetical protein